MSFRPVVVCKNSSPVHNVFSFCATKRFCDVNTGELNGGSGGCPPETTGLKEGDSILVVVCELAPAFFALGLVVASTRQPLVAETMCDSRCPGGTECHRLSNLAFPAKAR